MNSQALKGHLDLLLLSVLVDGPQHGYRIIEAIRERSGGVLDLAEGTVYPALRRLERAGWLDSAWERPEGRERRTYRLTARGQAALNQQRTQWSTFSFAMNRVMEGRS
jgi:transcriptional regulator